MGNNLKMVFSYHPYPCFFWVNEGALTFKHQHFMLNTAGLYYDPRFQLHNRFFLPLMRMKRLTKTTT